MLMCGSFRAFFSISRRVAQVGDPRVWIEVGTCCKRSDRRFLTAHEPQSNSPLVESKGERRL